MRKFCLLLCLLLGQNIYAQSPLVQKIWSLAQGGNWARFNGTNFTIGIVNNKALKNELTDFAKGKKIAGKDVEIIHIALTYQVKNYNIVFVDGESTRNSFINEVVDKATKGGFPSLVVTNREGMLAEGSPVNITSGGQIEINPPRLQATGVSLNTGAIPNVVVKTTKVNEENKINLPDLTRKDKDKESKQEHIGEHKKRDREQKAVPSPRPVDNALLSEAAADKALRDKNNESLKAYIKELEGMLDANKIDYQSLKKRYETDQAKAEEEIKSLNLTLIEHDSLHKKNELIAQQSIDLHKSRAETAKANARTNFYLAMGAGLLALLAIGSAYVTYRDRQTIAREKQKSENLLLSILPAETATELKNKGTATPRQYELASVLFTDFKGFTNVAEKMSPEELIQELNDCFLAFDEIAERNGLERIKTIGDSYMCVGGVPTANRSNPVDAVKAGIEMQAFMETFKAQKEAEGKPYFECRLGIHTGKVVAGVVGKKKFAYDIWGDTVNIASRMESSGEVNRINISADTYNIIKDQFQCEYRGKVNAKGKGDIDMYFVNGLNA